MRKRLKSNLRLCLRSFVASLLFAIIALAVLIQLGRAIFPILSDYRSTIESFVSDRVGAEVRIGELEASWQGLKPAVVLKDLEVSSEQGPIFSARSLMLEWNLLASLGDWREGVRKLHFDGLKATFEQQANGQWRLAGLPEPSTPDTDDEGNPIIDDPVDIFVFGRRLELANTDLLLKYRSGHELEVAVPLIQLENDNRFHRLSASFNVSGEEALTLVFEGYGDPRDSERFKARGFVQSNGFSAQKLLSGLAEAGLVDTEGMDQQVIPSGGTVNLALWFNGTPSAGVHVVGRLKLDQMQSPSDSKMQWPESVAAEFNGVWTAGGGWQLGVRHASAAWSDYQSPDLNLLVQGKPEAPVRIHTEGINLADWLQTALKTGALQGQLREVLETLAPTGKLTRAELTLTGKERGYFQLRASVQDVHTQPWQGAPGLSGISGYLSANAFDGHILLQADQGFAMDFPKVYRQPLRFEQARGDVRWTLYPEQKWVGVSSGNVHLKGPDFKGQGHFNLRLPYSARPGFEPEMTLVVAVPSAPAHYHKVFVPYTVPDELYHWLEQADPQGVAEDIAFVYHGTLMNDSDMQRVVQLAADVRNASLRFDKTWPHLEQAQAQLLVDDERLKVTNLNGRLAGNTLAGGAVSLRHNQAIDGNEVAVRGNLNGSTDKLLKLLMASPVQQKMDESMADWQARGNYQAEFEVVVPLNPEHDPRQSVQLALQDNALTLPLTGLRFTKLSGELYYSDAEGLRSDSLKARLWQRPVTARLYTAPGDDTLKIDFDGKVDMADIQRWSERPELQFASGVTRVTGTIAFPAEGPYATQVRARSDLEGIELALPAPFRKAAPAALPMQLRVNRQRQSDNRSAITDFVLNLDNGVHLHWKHNHQRLLGLTLAFADGSRRVAPGKVRINGSLERVPGLEWYELISDYLAAESTASSEQEEQGAGTERELPIEADLAIEELLLGDLSLPYIKAQGWGRDNRWRIDVENAQLGGHLRIVPDKPLAIDLDYLRLPGKTGSSQGQTTAVPGQLPVSAIDDFDTATLEPVDFKVQTLWLDEQNIGAWRFKLRPTEGGLMAYDLFADVAGLKISGGDDRGAQLVWLQSEAGQHSYFDGRITGADLGRAIEQLQGQKVLTSSSTDIGLRLEWPGAPDQFRLEQLTGLVDVSLTRGRFIRGATAGENPLLKLLGLFNFDTLARRLRLDFSDLHPEGMSYESLHGQLQFMAGEVHIPQPLVVDSTTVQLQMVGDMDLLAQTVDAELVVTLSFGGNLTFAAALTGGVPIAVGVYVLGKVFKEQMDKASSVRYDITGPWSEPEVEFDAIFDDSTTKGQER